MAFKKKCFNPKCKTILGGAHSFIEIMVVKKRGGRNGEKAVKIKICMSCAVSGFNGNVALAPNNIRHVLHLT